MKIVCDDKIPLIKGVFEPYADIVYKSGSSIIASDLIDADALIIRTRTICNEALLKDSNIKIIASATIGYDHIDTSYCEKNSIKWLNAPGCNSLSVANYIASSLIYLSIKHSFNLKNKTLGIVGVGNVGSKVKLLAEKMGMHTLLCDPYKGYNTSLDEIISSSDIITLHIPLDKSTYHLLSSENISKLSNNQILINSSRGAVVDNIALKKALKDKRILGAVLDVWENEPNIDTELLDLLDIATPHIAGYSLDGKAAATKAVVRSVSAELRLPLNDWSPELPFVPPSSLKFEDSIRAAYKVEEDDLRLRQNPLAFEQLRGNYPIRRDINI